MARYNSSCNHSFFKNLHELRRLQATRSGAAVAPPAALDVDLTVNQERSQLIDSKKHQHATQSLGVSETQRGSGEEMIDLPNEIRATSKLGFGLGRP